MVDIKLIAISLICVVLSVGVIGAVMLLDQKDTELQIQNDQIFGFETEKLTLETYISKLQANVSSFQSEATLLNNEKNALETQVSALQANISVVRSEATLLNNEKSVLEIQVLVLGADISELQSEIVTLENDKLSLETQVSNLQTDVADLEDGVIESYSLGYVEGEFEGYQLGYDEGYTLGVADLTQDGWYLRDPTYAEAIAFVNLDVTDENQYTTDYVCYDFTADFNENATRSGYMCGFVYIEFVNSAHAISCFNTTDQGLIYVEPQTDEIVTITIGQSYLGSIIVDFGIIW